MKSLKIIILFLSICIVAMTDLYGQSFMRYKMKDGSYNGFYTSAVDSIAHVTENGVIVQKVYSCETVKTIPVDNIIEISFEGASLNSEQDAGEYKIVEFDGKEGFKKAYVDNRAMLIASKTGDFFANDTILFASAYNDVECLFFTNDEGQVTRYFDGENYLVFDKDYEAYPVEKISRMSASSTKGAAKVFINGLKLLFTKLGTVEDDLALKAVDIGTAQYIENLGMILNDPELHSQRCIVAALSLVGAMMDPIAYVSSILATVNYNDDNQAKLFDDFYGGIAASMSDLLNEMHPDYETRQKYAEFYANKYNIQLSPNTPTDITATSARLNGSIYTEDGLRGNLYFRVWEFLKDEHIHVPAVNEYGRVNEWEIKAAISNLKPDTWYIGDIVYEFTVDKLKLEISSEPFDFETLTPIAYTGTAKNITSTSAVIDCEYTNADGCWCGLEYSGTSESGATSSGVASAASNGKQSITLSGLLPNTTYTYYAIAKIDDKEFKGESKTFTTEPEPLPDLSGVWTFDQSIFSNPTLTVYLELSSSTSTSATYDAQAGFYGVNWLSVTINKDFSGSIQTGSPQGYRQSCTGTFNDDCTSIAGDRFFYITPSWSDTGRWIDEPWCLHR